MTRNTDRQGISQLTLSADTVAPVAHGHPWVYPEGIARGPLPPAGTPVELLDPRGRLVAWGIADSGDIVVRVLSREPRRIPELLAERIHLADRARERLLRSSTDAYRLVNGEGDGLPGVVLDRYGELLVVRLYSAAWLPWMDDLVSEIRRLPWVRCAIRRLGVEKVEGRTAAGGVRRGGELLFGTSIPERLVVHENGLRFLVRPLKGQKTGLFLDQRENRAWVRESSSSVTMMVNLFGYNGAFSVYARAGGARTTFTVDIAVDALEDARENFLLNGFDPAEHVFEKADAFSWLHPAKAELVVCDPPSLSKAEASEQAARRAYRDLNAHAARMVEQGGTLLSCSCTARIREERWMDSVQAGLRQTGGTWSILRRSFEPFDHPVALGHPEGRYLKAVALRRWV